MQAMRFNFRTLCRNAAERGGQMQQRLLDALEARHTVKTLPEFGIERAAQLGELHRQPHPQSGNPRRSTRTADGGSRLDSAPYI